MFKMKYEIETMYLTPKTKRRSGILMPYVGFIVSHDTGNDGSTAKGNIGWYEDTCNDDSASAQTFIDHKHIIECIPATTGKPEKAWHVRYNRPEDNVLFGDDANDIAIGVELCFSHNKGSIDNKEAYKRYVWYHAYLCHKYNLDPCKKIIGHNELDPARKSDPFKNALKIMGISKAQFIQDVVNELADCTKVVEPPIAPVEVVSPPMPQKAPEVVEAPIKEVRKLNAKTVEEAKKAIDKLASEGLITSPDYWKARVEDNLPVWAYMIIESRKLPEE